VAAPQRAAPPAAPPLAPGPPRRPVQLVVSSVLLGLWILFLAVTAITG
jgi:hypothetical protein